MCVRLSRKKEKVDVVHMITQLQHTRRTCEHVQYFWRIIQKPLMRASWMLHQDNRWDNMSRSLPFKNKKTPVGSRPHLYSSYVTNKHQQNDKVNFINNLGAVSVYLDLGYSSLVVKEWIKCSESMTWRRVSGEICPSVFDQAAVWPFPVGRVDNGFTDSCLLTRLRSNTCQKSNKRPD